MADDVRRLIAGGIANARGNRRGVPRISNILDMLPQKLRDEVIDDAESARAALVEAGWVVVDRYHLADWLTQAEGCWQTHYGHYREEPAEPPHITQMRAALSALPGPPGEKP